MTTENGWTPIRVDQTGNCWEWEYRAEGTRIIVEPAAHAYIVGLQKRLAEFEERDQRHEGLVGYEPIKGWMGIEDARDGHVVVLTQEVFDVIHGEPFPVYRKCAYARAEVGRDSESTTTDASASERQ